MTTGKKKKEGIKDRSVTDFEMSERQGIKLCQNGGEKKKKNKKIKKS